MRDEEKSNFLTAKSEFFLKVSIFFGSKQLIFWRFLVNGMRKIDLYLIRKISQQELFEL